MTPVRRKVPYPETTSGLLSVHTGHAGQGKARHPRPVPEGASGQPRLMELAGGAGEAEVHKG